MSSIECTRDDGAATPGEFFGHRVRRVRQARGISSRKFADMTGKTRAWMQTAETATRDIRVEDAAQIARTLGVPLGPLLSPDALCVTCQGWPQAGFQCLACGAGGGTA